MKLHWSPKSPFVRKVMVAAHELGLVDRLDRVRNVAAMAGTNPAIMADTPLNKIPALLTDDGELVVDSLVICEYLDDLAGGGRLFPPPGPARWRALTWHTLANGLLDLLILWRNERDKPAERQTPEWLAAFSAKVTATLDLFEREIAALDATPFGIAQIGLGCALGYADFRFQEVGWRDGRPSLTAWFETFSARPSAIATEVKDG